jgi:CDGSH-type Zn-finger protein
MGGKIGWPYTPASVEVKEHICQHFRGNRTISVDETAFGMSINSRATLCKSGLTVNRKFCFYGNGKFVDQNKALDKKTRSLFFENEYFVKTYDM